MNVRSAGLLQAWLDPGSLGSCFLLLASFSGMLCSDGKDSPWALWTAIVPAQREKSISSAFSNGMT